MTDQTAQHPATPETDASALVRAGLRKCRVEDGSPVALIRESDLMHITHMVVTELVPLLADLTATRERLRVVEGEREAANVHAIECERIGVEAIEARLMETHRAESAEAALDALWAGIEALVERFVQHEDYARSLVKGRTPTDKMHRREANTWNVASCELRALLPGDGR